LVAVSLGLALALFRPGLLRPQRGQVGYLVMYGLALAGFNAVWTTAVALNGAAVGTVMAYTSAAFTAVLGWWLLHETMSAGKVVAVVLALGGCVVVSGAWSAAAWRLNLLGVVTGLLSGLGYSIYALMGRRAALSKINPWTVVLYTFGFASVWMLGANLVGGSVIPGAARRVADLLWLGTSVKGWGALLVLAAGPTLVGFGLINVALGYLPSSTANLILTVEPVFTAVVAWFVLGERFTAEHLLGSALIGAGVLWLRLSERSAG
jgi:drug/metabolite transporter (DMT)-like permease